MKKPSRNKRKSKGHHSGNLLPALFAVGGACGLAAMPSAALELGNVQVQSPFGQPLRASIAFALGPNEQIYDYCIYLRPAAGGVAMPTISAAQIAVTGNTIVLTGGTPIREPLLAIQIAVDCPYTPRLERDYTVFVDPVLPVQSDSQVTERVVADPAAAKASNAAETTRPAANPGSAPTALSPLPAGQSSVEANAQYRVRVGDSASTIAARISGRTVGLWSTVNHLVAANPDAFIDGDANRLVAGALLVIPAMDGQGMTTKAPAANSAQRPGEATIPAVVAAAEPSPATNAEAGTGDSVIEIDEAELAATPLAAATSVATPAVTADAEVARVEPPVDAVADLRPGDVIVTPRADSSTGDGERTAAVPRVGPGSSAKAQNSWSTIAWLGGAASLLIFGFIYVGRVLRSRFRSVPVGAGNRQEVASDSASARAHAAVDDVDFRFDDAIAADAISLDADLEAGTGLRGGAEMDVAQDFGFGATGQYESEFDFEITEEASREPEKSTTDVIAPSHRVEESSILESEVAPEDDDYDMSMIVDATKQHIDEYDATAKDLQAVPVGQIFDDSEYSISDDTLNNEVDLATLEKDYEDEFTATMALNDEIEQVARELADRLDTDDFNAASVDFELGPTVEMPTAGMPESNKPAGERDTEVTAELTANIAADRNAVNDDDADDEVTSKMLAAGSDVTVDMQIESGTIDTKEHKA